MTPGAVTAYLTMVLMLHSVNKETHFPLSIWIAFSIAGDKVRLTRVFCLEPRFKFATRTIFASQICCQAKRAGVQYETKAKMLAVNGAESTLIVACFGIVGLAPSKLRQSAGGHDNYPQSEQPQKLRRAHCGGISWPLSAVTSFHLRIKLCALYS